MRLFNILFIGHWIILGGISMAIQQAQGCGFDGSAPANHFDGVNEAGYLAYWTKMTELKLRDGTVLPIVLGFRSNHDRTTASPYLGQGWVFPILESDVVQISENGFLMLQPDGWSNVFGREKANLIRGGGAWIGTIDGDNITFESQCGWRMIYHKGHLQTLSTPGGDRLDYHYFDNIVDNVSENSVVRIKVLRDTHGRVTGVVIDGKERDLPAGEKPRVENIAGTRLIAGLDASLKSVRTDKDGIETFAYGVDSKMNLTFDITTSAGGARHFVWNPESGRLISDGNWFYQFQFPNGSSGNAYITRNQGSENHEAWFYDASGGKEITEKEGVKTIRNWFTSGIATGKIRKIEKVANGQTQIIFQASYDENGQLLRCVRDGLTLEKISNGTIKLTLPDKKVYNIAAPVFTNENNL